MKREKRNLLKQVTSLVLAAVMMFSVTAIAAPNSVKAAEKSFAKNGGTVTISDEESYVATQEYSWIKYKAAQDGYLRVKMSNATQLQEIGYAFGTTQLYDASRTKALSTESVWSTDAVNAMFVTDYYGVKKGKTYYFKVGSMGGVSVQAQLTKYKDKSGTKKQKASWKLHGKKRKTVKQRWWRKPRQKQPESLSGPAVRLSWRRERQWTT